jgi:putative transposase
MREWQSQSHVRWYCRYHVLWVPGYRKRAIFGQLRGGIGKILRGLSKRYGVELLEGRAQPDHVHFLLSVAPKFSVANTVGFLKGKSAIRIHREYMGRPRNFTGNRLATVNAPEKCEQSVRIVPFTLPRKLGDSSVIH